MAVKAVRNPFDAPERQPREARDESVRPRGIEQWVKDLPVANTEKTALELFHKLDLLNRLEIPAPERYRMLECLREPLDLVLSQLVKQYVRNTPSLSRHEQQLADLAQQLQALVVLAYKIAAEQMPGGWLVRQLAYRRRRASAVHRVIHYLGRMLLADYQLYRPCTAFLWLEINRVYHYAERVSVANKLINSENTAVVAKSTIADRYRQMLLLALAGPYRLLPGQAKKVYQVLEHWAPLCRLRVSDGEPAPTELFAVARAEDRPPTYVENFQDKKFQGWYLDVAPLGGVLRAGLEVIQAGKPSFGVARPGAAPLELDGDLLRTLMMSWGVRVDRSGPRTEAAGEIRAIFGLEGIFWLLGGEAPRELMRAPGFAAPKAAPPPPKKKEPRTIRPGQDERLAWVGRGDIVEQIELEEPRKAPDWTAEEHRSPLVAEKRGKIDDRSQGGYQLTLPEGVGSSARVGELLALTEAQDQVSGPDWRLGIVRWMRITNSGETELGVQLVKAEAKPVVVERTRQAASFLERWLGLMLSSSGDKGESLITPAFYAGADDCYALLFKDRYEPVRLVTTLEATPSFAQFRFELIGHEGGSASGREGGEPEQSDDERDEEYFADLWRNL